MHVRTEDGDLALHRDGVTFRPYSLHGKASATTWGWDEVRHVTVEQGGRVSTTMSRMWGLWGWLLRPQHVMVVVSLPDGDVTFATRDRLPLLRSAALRLMEDVPAARVTVP